MELDGRKKAILNAIIRNYQETGEPVGSRTISKLAELQVSPATIRNEMADLEEMGLIVQPHTSAGRVPTDKGYRLYVDELMQSAELAPIDKQLPAEKSREEMLINRVDRVEELLMQMAKILAQNTKYATMVTGPNYSGNKLKFIQLSPMDKGKILAVIVLEGNVIKNNILSVGDNLGDEEILNLNFILNSNLNGLCAEEINIGIISKIKDEAGAHSEVASKVLDAVAEAITAEEKPNVYTSGAKNIFEYPELSGGDTASEIISTLEEKELLRPVFSGDRKFEDKHDIQVYIGDEVPVDSMKDCSVVTATYELSNGVQGKIGIIGPKRMDYEKVVSTLKDTMSQLDDIFKNEEVE